MKRHVLLVLLLYAASLAAYCNSFSSGFVYDNQEIILGDARIRAVTTANIQRIFSKAYWQTNPEGLYRPLTTLSYLFNYAILGDGISPAGYHWINLGLHWLNLSLVYLLTLRLLGGTAPAFAAAALWGLHPILTESVTNIVGRADELAAASVLGGLLCHLQAASATGLRKLCWLLALMGLAAIGIFSKESAAVLPEVLFLHDFLFQNARGWKATAGGYLAALIPLAAFGSARASVLSALGPVMVPVVNNPLADAGFWTARLTAVKVIGKYLGLLVWPRYLSSDYSYNQIPLVIPGRLDRETWAALIACAAATLVAAIACRRARPAAFFIGLSFVALLPTSNLIFTMGTIMAERFLYLPAIGFAACIAMLIFKTAGRRRSLAIVSVVVLSIALGARTYARNSDWRDEESLWTSAEAAAPASFRPHLVLATIYRDKPPESVNLDRAISEMEQSVGILNRLRDEEKLLRPYILAGQYYRAKGEQAGDKRWSEKSRTVLEQGVAIYRAFNLKVVEMQMLNPGAPLSVRYGSILYRDLGLACMCLQQKREALEAFDVALSMPDCAATTYLEITEARKTLGVP